MTRTSVALLTGFLPFLSVPVAVHGTDAAELVEANRVIQVVLLSEKTYANPFAAVELDAIVIQPDGTELKVPAFWAGENRWCFRYASEKSGQHPWHTECSDKENTSLHGANGVIQVTPSPSDCPLSRHGPIRVAGNRRHFEHIDGTPFFWLGDTWWKNLCKRMTWEGFQRLAADRQTKGFTVIQIVCGPYPDEGPFEPRWENEGGKPYETRDFSRVNPVYFDFADRRIQHLVATGLVPAIVGGWGRADCDGMKLAGVEGLNRHWRHLIARYGAYPTVWIIGGESQGPLWTEVAAYVRRTDPYHRPVTMHPHNSARNSVTDERVIDFDMLQTGHGNWEAAIGAAPKLQAAYSRTPAMPVMIGEYCYEGHMQTAFQDIQRYVFWSGMLSGSAGLTYGAAGVWHASVEGDPGLANIYDWTTWEEGMNFPGSAQLGLNKRLLEEYPWWRFEPHPEWTQDGAFAAGIPGEVRFIYLPRRNVYDWTGPRIRRLEQNTPHHAFYFDPATGRRFDLGIVVNAGPAPKPFDGHTQPLRFEDDFERADPSAWKDYGSPTRREDGTLIGTKNMATVVDKLEEADLMVTVDARSDAEAGIILRFHDLDNYLIALYSPLLKEIYWHDRQNGQWGTLLGKVSVPEIGPKIRLTAAACGDYAAMVLTDGTRTFQTQVVKVRNLTSGKVGLWLYQIGERQQYDNFDVSATPFPRPEGNDRVDWKRLSGDDDRAPALPSPQDWVLVLERADGRVIEKYK